MLGFWKKRLWKEHVKLATQNLLACRYLSDFESNMVEAGLKKPAPQFQFPFDDDLSADYLAVLRSGEALPGMVADDALKLNRDLRRVFDAVLAGRNAFASMFGSVSERLLPFDQMFAPNEGWAVYLDHFRNLPNCAQRQRSSSLAEGSLDASLEAMPQRTFEEMVAIGQELALEDTEQNLRVRVQQRQARKAEDRLETLCSGEEIEDRNPSIHLSAQPAWKITETSMNMGLPGRSILLEYHRLRLANSPVTPFFELNNTSDDEATTVDLMIPMPGEAQPKKIRIHTRHMYKFDKQTVLEAIDDAIEQYALPRLEGETRNAVDAVANRI